jgi:hypothetical protein
MAEGAEKVEDAGVGAEESESASSSSSLGRSASLGGECELFLARRPLLRVSRAGEVGVAAEADLEVTELLAREAARRSDLSALSLRLLPDMDSISLSRFGWLRCSSAPISQAFRILVSFPLRITI